MGIVKVDKFELPDDLYYHQDHSWLKIDGAKVRVGMDDFGQKAAGKILFVRLRAAGKDVEQGKSLGSVESGKWVGAVKSPVSGKIVEVNEKLKDDPSLVNTSPYGDGWMAVIEPSNLEADLKVLITSAPKITEWLKKDIQERLK